MGFSVYQVGRVYSSIITPPKDIIGVYEYTARDLLNLLGVNNFQLSMDPPLSGQGYCIAILDSGIMSTHLSLDSKVIYNRNFTSYPNGDKFNHGTAVASMTHAAVPDADILDMKVIGDNGTGTEEAVVLAIDECIGLLYTNPALAPNVINLSLGAPDDGDPNNPLRVACRAAIDAGIVVVAAAGNYGPSGKTITAPACEEYIIAVGCMSRSPLEVSEFSSRGPTIEGLIKPDTTFLGENVIVASANGDTETMAKSGTSFSAPLVSGVIVLTMEGIARTYSIPRGMYVGKNFLTNRIIIDRMLPTVCSKPKGIPREKDNDYGFGLPVGSIIQKGVAQVGLIDIEGTIRLSMSIMIIMIVARMMGEK